MIKTSTLILSGVVFSVIGIFGGSGCQEPNKIHPEPGWAETAALTWATTLGDEHPRAYCSYNEDRDYAECSVNAFGSIHKLQCGIGGKYPDGNGCVEVLSRR